MKRFKQNELIGEYRVTRFLGQGGMGEVYQGVHEKLGRSAAIKVLGGSATADPSFKTRFFNEARLQAALHHPNIAALYDFREEDGQLYIFMEFVDGESLDELVKGRALAVEDALSIFASVCEAVSYIHQNGVVHRDIKSQNIKLTSTGTAKLLDFGIAKDSASLGLTQTGGVVGTPHYLAPEQLDGKPANAQSDIWALGVLLYEMLTGNMPFRGDSLPSLVLSITQAQFAAPEDSNPAVPPDVSRIVKKCLAKDPASRYLTAYELHRDVQSALQRRQGNKTTGLTGTFTFRASDKPELIATTVVPDATPEAKYFAPEPAIAGKSPVVWIAAGSVAAVFFLVMIAGAGIWAISGSGQGRSPVQDQAVVTKNSPAQITGRNTLQKVRVDVDEGQAQVLRDGRLLGTTPYDLEAALGDSVSLTLRRDGYEDKNVQLEITGGKKVFTFSLRSR